MMFAQERAAAAVLCLEHLCWVFMSMQSQDAAAVLYLWGLV